MSFVPPGVGDEYEEGHQDNILKHDNNTNKIINPPISGPPQNPQIDDKTFKAINLYLT